MNNIFLLLVANLTSTTMKKGQKGKEDITINHITSNHALCSFIFLKKKNNMG